MSLKSETGFEMWKIKMIMVRQMGNGKGLKEDIKTKAKVGHRCL